MEWKWGCKMTILMTQNFTKFYLTLCLIINFGNVEALNIINIEKATTQINIDRPCNERNLQTYFRQRKNDEDEEEETQLKLSKCDICCCNLESQKIDCSGERSSNIYNLIDIEKNYNANFTHYYVQENGLSNLADFSLLRDRKSLILLDGSYNNLETLDLTELELLDNLKYLSLSENKIEKIYPPNRPIKALQYLDLSKNKIEKLDNMTFEGLGSLHVLDLSGNNVTHLESYAFTRLPQLKSLILKNNKIKSVTSNNFVGLRQIVHLDLSDNLVQTVEEPLFKFMPNLKKLLFARNQLSFISSNAFEGLTFLEKLDLSSNWFANIHPDTFKPIPTGHKQQILLHDNPLMCNCDLRYLVSWVSRWTYRVDRARHLKCSHVTGDGKDNAGKSLMELSSNELCDWLEELRDMVLVPVAVIVSIAITVIFGCCCRKKRSGSADSITTVSTSYPGIYGENCSVRSGTSSNTPSSDNTHTTLFSHHHGSDTRRYNLPASLVPVSVTPVVSKRKEAINGGDPMDPNCLKNNLYGNGIRRNRCESLENISQYSFDQTESTPAPIRKSESQRKTSKQPTNQHRVRTKRSSGNQKRSSKQNQRSSGRGRRDRQSYYATSDDASSAYYTSDCRDSSDYSPLTSDQED